MSFNTEVEQVCRKSIGIELEKQIVALKTLHKIFKNNDVSIPEEDINVYDEILKQFKRIIGTSFHKCLPEVIDKLFNDLLHSHGVKEDVFKLSEINYIIGAMTDQMKDPHSFEESCEIIHSKDEFNKWYAMACIFGGFDEKYENIKYDEIQDSTNETPLNFKETIWFGLLIEDISDWTNKYKPDVNKHSVIGKKSNIYKFFLSQDNKTQAQIIAYLKSCLDDPDRAFESDWHDSSLYEKKDKEYEWYWSFSGGLITELSRLLVLLYQQMDSPSYKTSRVLFSVLLYFYESVSRWYTLEHIESVMPSVSFKKTCPKEKVEEIVKFTQNYRKKIDIGFGFYSGANNDLDYFFENKFNQYIGINTPLLAYDNWALSCQKMITQFTSEEQKQWVEFFDYCYTLKNKPSKTWYKKLSQLTIINNQTTFLTHGIAFLSFLDGADNQERYDDIYINGWTYFHEEYQRKISLHAINHLNKKPLCGLIYALGYFNKENTLLADTLTVAVEHLSLSIFDWGSKSTKVALASVYCLAEFKTDIAKKQLTSIADNTQDQQVLKQATNHLNKLGYTWKKKPVIKINNQYMDLKQKITVDQWKNFIKKNQSIINSERYKEAIKTIVDYGWAFTPEIGGALILEFILRNFSRNYQCIQPLLDKKMNYMTYLIQQGASLDFHATLYDEPETGTPLMQASQRACPELVKLLLDEGAEPDSQDEKGYTALMYACGQVYPKSAAKWFAQEEFLENIKHLINAGADTHLKSDNKKTALSIAKLSKHQQAIEYLTMYP